MVENANTILRDFTIDGVPSSGANKVSKVKFRQMLTQVEDRIEALIAGAGGITLPDRVIAATNTGGTANAILASSDRTLTGVAYSQLITVNFTAANTGPMTLSINGELPRALVTNTGRPIQPNYVQAAMTALLQLDSAGKYRLFSYGDVEAIVEGFALEARIARDEALSAAGEITGRALVYPGTGLQIYDAGGRKIGGLADASGDEDAVNRRTLLALAVTTAGGVLVGKGQRLTALADGTDQQDAVTKKQLDTVFSTVTHTTRNIPHANFNFLADYGQVYDCPAPGFARHNIDIATAWQQKYKGLTGAGGVNFPQNTPNLTADKFVDWVNGLDTNAGSINAPYKTVVKAIANTLHTIWMLPGDSKEVINADYANTINANGRPFRLRALVPGTVRFISRGETSAELTWVASGTGYHTATPASGASVASISWNPAPGVYVPVPYNPAVNTGFWWTQSSSTKEIALRAFGKDLANASVKGQFIIAYFQAANHTLNGLNCLIQDIDFVGTGQLTSSFDATKTRRPVLFLKDCKFILQSNGNAIHSDGGLVVSQNCHVYGPAFDGWNYYVGDNAGATPCTFLEIDCSAKYCGWMHSIDGISPTRNNQGSSGHEGSYGIRVNGEYGEGGYGQGIADTGANAYYWMIGTKVHDTYFDLYGANNDRFYSLWMEGRYWLDTCQAGGLGSSYGLYASGGVGKVFASDFKGVTVNVGGDNNYSIGEYIPFGEAS